MPLILSLLRHAKSSWDDPALDDSERGLAPRGVRAAPHMGKAMRKLRLMPDLILCSSAIRARATLALLLPELRLSEPEIQYEDGLYLCTPGAILDRLSKVSDGAAHVLVVGHNPGLHALVLELAGRGDKAALAEVASKFPTASLAVLRFEASSWRDVRAGSGSLECFLTPRGLKA